VTPRALPSRFVVAGSLLLGAVLSGCGVPVAGTGPDAAVPLDAHVFGAQRPTWADCSRVDLAGLGEISAIEVPAGTAQLELLDPKRPELSWARCVGLTEATSTDQGKVVWLVSFATSTDATTDADRVPQLGPQPSMRALTRPARLGDARAEVLLDVHADTHDTVVFVTVYDPQTQRAAASCAIAQARGDEADRAADWCLKTVADQLAKPWRKRPTPSPSVTGSGSASGSAAASGSAEASGSPSPSPSPSSTSGGASPTASGPASPTGAGRATVTVTVPGPTAGA